MVQTALALAAILAELGQPHHDDTRFFEAKTLDQALARLAVLTDLSRVLIDPLVGHNKNAAVRHLNLAADAIADANPDAARRHVLEAIKKASGLRASI